MNGEQRKHCTTEHRPLEGTPSQHQNVLSGFEAGRGGVKTGGTVWYPQLIPNRPVDV